MSLPKPVTLSVFLSLSASCATFDSAGDVTARRNANPVSDAEYKQTMKQQQIESNEVSLERQKRDNAVDTIWDTSSAIHGVRSVGRGLGIR